ncbi:MAG: phosphatase PAP2 family protein, partial [Desulfobacterales bacterium]|nr:phosphatase PAP2 family protein [Desulfobacterales bacterium]
MKLDFRQHKGFIGLLTGFAVAMVWATSVDYSLTKWLGENSWTVFAEFMDRSLFEGEGFGGGDPVILLLIGVVCAYALSRRPAAPERLAVLRPALGFMLVGGILAAFVNVHTLKWLMARARPYLVFDGRYAFSAWYEIGPHFITEGVYRGSFPSGHTAQAFAVMVCAYALVGSPLASRGRKAGGWVVGSVTVGYTLAMGLARCMAGVHWVTDVIGAAALSWITLHILYFYILKVPQQELHRHALYQTGGLNSRWDLLLGLYLAAFALGLVLTGFGLRASVGAHVGWPATLLIPGVPLLVWGIRGSTVCWRRLNRLLLPIETEP